MSEITHLSEADEHFINQFLPIKGHDSTRPFVTLTYACSLDGMIAIAPGTRTTLSGPESKSMTHYLRAHHDAILVGVGTVIADDPSLNCRYPDSSGEMHQIQPVVLDPALRWNGQQSKAAALARQGQGKKPWVFYNRDVAYGQPGDDVVEYIEAGSESTTGRRLEMLNVLRELRSRGVRSVMVEGGAAVIGSLLDQPHLIDQVIITIAPTWLGSGSVAASPQAKHQNGVKVNVTTLKRTNSQQFGQDVVFCGKLSG